MTPTLIILLVLALIAVAWLLTRVRLLNAQRDEAREEAATAVTEHAAATARLEETQAQRDQLLRERDGQDEAQGELAGELTKLTQNVGEMRTTLDGAKTKATEAAEGMTRLDGHLTGFTKRLANPQSRGAFGEEALRNQLEVLGFAEGRDYRRQVRESRTGRRIDYTVELRGVTIGLDAKFALDPDLAELALALEEGDQERIRPFARKLVARAKELSAKVYWAHLDRSPSFVLMYVPLEGAQEALFSLPDFSYDKFALQHRVYLVSPLQLGTTLGVIADVAHAEKRSEEIEEVHRELVSLDQELGKFCDLHHKHGRQISAVVTSYDATAAMLSTRGGLGRMASRLRAYTRRAFSRPEDLHLHAARDDVVDIGEAYRKADAETSAELRRSA
ncbi:MAG: DNA recombination protein RmuC [Solirubrobacterales bacterium]